MKIRFLLYGAIAIALFLYFNKDKIEFLIAMSRTYDVAIKRLSKDGYDVLPASNCLVVDVQDLIKVETRTVCLE